MSNTALLACFAAFENVADHMNEIVAVPAPVERVLLTTIMSGWRAGSTRDNFCRCVYPSATRGRYCSASATWAVVMHSSAAKSAMVRASLSTRW